MLKELLYELSRGLAYRRIRHDEMPKYTVVLPLVLYAVMLATYLFLPASPVWLGKDGVIVGLLGIMATLPGFYFAGLAAVATFGAPGMDLEMPNPTPEVDLLVQGKRVPSKLTRRQFLSYLFSYLVIISFALCFGLLALGALSDTIISWHVEVIRLPWGEWAWALIKFGIFTVFALMFASMAITTLHGIYFLTEKMHQP